MHKRVYLFTPMQRNLVLIFLCLKTSTLSNGITPPSHHNCCITPRPLYTLTWAVSMMQGGGGVEEGVEGGGGEGREGGGEDY